MSSMSTTVLRSAQIKNHYDFTGAEFVFLSDMIKMIDRKFDGLTEEEKVQATRFLDKLHEDQISKQSEYWAALESFKNKYINVLESDRDKLEVQQQLLYDKAREKMHNVCKECFEGKDFNLMFKDARKAFLCMMRKQDEVGQLIAQIHTHKYREGLRQREDRVSKQAQPHLEALGKDDSIDNAEARLRIRALARIEVFTRETNKALEHDLRKLHEERDARTARALEIIEREAREKVFAAYMSSESIEFEEHKTLQDLDGRISRINALVHDLRQHDGPVRYFGYGENLKCYQYQMDKTRCIYIAYKSLTAASLGFVSAELHDCYKRATAFWAAELAKIHSTWCVAYRLSEGRE